ncbi:type II secretion system GspH family protein [Rubripirellula sp.]|nr:type II secretion system GspH family protein [Rubripirellula sp.]
MINQTFHQTGLQTPILPQDFSMSDFSMSDLSKPDHSKGPDLGSRPASRPAFTLIEILVSLVILSSLMGSALGLLTLVQRSNERATSNRLFRQQVRAFAKMFREDADARDSELLFDSNGELRVLTTTENITYRIVDGSKISRVQTTTDQQITRREDFDFGAGIEVQLSQDPADATARWIITDRRFRKQPITVIAGWKEREA